jgi:nitroreductase
MSSDFDSNLAFIFGRRSIRAYQKKRIPEEMVEALLRAAMAAPSAVNKNPWRFIVLRDKKRLAAIAQGLPNGKMLGECSVGIVVCGDLEVAHDKQIGYLLQDCSAAIENLLLAAHILGLGACWLGVYPRDDRVAHLRNLMSLPDHVLPISCISIGFPAENKESRTRYSPDCVHYEKW